MQYRKLESSRLIQQLFIAIQQPLVSGRLAKFCVCLIGSFVLIGGRPSHGSVWCYVCILEHFSGFE